MNNYELKNILNLLIILSGFAFSGYRTSMLECRVQKKILAPDINKLLNRKQ